MAFRRSIKSKPISVPQPPKEISIDLATKILDLENQVNKFPTPTLIEKLIDCYSECIEFYSKKSDLKYLDFQKRMHSLLSSPQILLVLNGKQADSNKTPSKPAEPVKKTAKINESKPASSKKPLEPNRVTKKTDEDRQRNNTEGSPFRNMIYEKMSLGDISPVSTCPSNPSPKSQERPHSVSLKGLKFDPQSFALPQRPPKNLKIIFDRHEANTKDTVNKAIKDFQSQDSVLSSRLASRKKQTLTRSMSNFSFSSMNLSDILEETENAEKPRNGFFVIEEHPVEMDKFEIMLEDIMDRNFAERAAKIAETRGKYESQISEMSGMGDLMQMVIAQMKDNMKKEIEEIVEEFDKKRKEDIRILKEKKGLNYI